MMPQKILVCAFLFVFLMPSQGVFAQKKNKKKEKTEKRPTWVTSRPVDGSYYHGVGVAMVNTYTQGHVEDAKKKALNDIISEISVSIKSASIMHQIEQDDELNSMYQSLTNIKAENDIEGYELVDSWGNEKEYWVYYRLSKSLYQSKKRNKIMRALAVATKYKETGDLALEKGEAGLAYEDYIRGLAALKEFINEDVSINTADGQRNLVDLLVEKIISLSREIVLTSNIRTLKTRVAKTVDEEILVQSKYQSGPVFLNLTALFTKGEGESTVVNSKEYIGQTAVKIHRVTGGELNQILRVSPNIESMTGEPEGEALIAKLIRLKTNVPHVDINIETQRLMAVLEVDEKRFGEPVGHSAIANTIRDLLSKNAYSFTTEKKQADVVIKLSIQSKKGDEKPLKKYILYTSYVDLYVSIVNVKSGTQVFYKGFSDVKGARSGSFEYALKDAEVLVLKRFETELLPEVNGIDLQ